jgi:tRNA pseudouridine55 synthase
MRDSILLIDKPDGISSYDVIRKLQKLLLETGIPRKQLPKMGHGGTLDPFATGLLIVLIGEAAKLSSLFLGSVKEYEGEIVFGASTSSGDIDTEIQERVECPSALGELQTYAQSFVKESYMQVPPMYSAKKVNGKKLYNMARKNKTIEREPVERQVHHFEILDFDGQYSKFRVRCSAGTYVRVLAEDLAKKLGSLAHLKTLRRTASGDKRIEQAVDLQTLEGMLKMNSELDACPAWIPLIDVIPKAIKLEVPATMLAQIYQGKNEPLAFAREQFSEQSGFVFLTYQGQIMAWLEFLDGDCRYRRVLIKQPPV